jgi:hypothetical protein
MNATNYQVVNGYPKQNCSEEWAKHRKLKIAFWGLFAGWIPCGFLVITATNWLKFPNYALAAIVVPYALAWIVLHIIVSNFRCPRCGSRFYAWGPWGLGHNGFATKCRNCGLRKWQCDGTVETSDRISVKS